MKEDTCYLQILLHLRFLFRLHGKAFVIIPFSRFLKNCSSQYRDFHSITHISYMVKQQESNRFQDINPLMGYTDAY